MLFSFITSGLCALDTDIDHKFRLAETKLGNDGVGHQYGVRLFEQGKIREGHMNFW
jgi:hypothetical protein